jgi:four helix bundle protein
MKFKFERLVVWQKSLDLADKVHELAKHFPKEEMFVLSSQLRRAADSVSLNIAEGSTSQTNPEQKRFLSIALRSNMEVVGGLHLARRRGYLKNDEFTEVYSICHEMLLMLAAMRKKL